MFHLGRSKTGEIRIELLTSTTERLAANSCFASQSIGMRSRDSVQKVGVKLISIVCYVCEELNKCCCGGKGIWASTRYARRHQHRAGQYHGGFRQ